MSLFQELNRRHVFRTALLYAVSGWLILQIGDLLFDLMGLPDFALRIVLGILVLGFPVVLVFAWAYEITPDGIKKESELVHDPVDAARVDRKLNIAVIAVAVLAVALLGVDRLMPETSPQASATELAEITDPDTSGTSSIGEPTSPAIDPASIAVLPFDDLSPEGDQEYFSSGIAEEILNVLVRIQGLEVASRTSAFRFRDRKDIGIPGIASELNVRHVLEGSVRKAGNSIRVTAQLIDGQSDKHLWSETYDRSLTVENVFAIQDEIASSIVEALRGSFELPEDAQVNVENSTDDLDAYELYLQARNYFQGRRRLDEADALLETAVDIDPDFASAWEMRAAINMIFPDYGYEHRSADESRRLAMDFARRALAIEPASATAIAVIAYLQFSENQKLQATHSLAGSIDELERALELEPRNASALNWLGLVYLWVGDMNAALAAFSRCKEYEPRYASCVENAHDALASMGRYGEAMVAYQDALARGVSTNHWATFSILAHFEKELAFLYAVNQPKWMAGYDRPQAIYNAFRNPTGDHTELQAHILLFLQRERPEALVGTSYLAGLLIPVGLFNLHPFGLYFWSPEYHGYRQSPQFKQLMRESGALAYWRERGWPDGCQPLDGDDFECH